MITKYNSVTVEVKLMFTMNDLVVVHVSVYGVGWGSILLRIIEFVKECLLYRFFNLFF